jgi:DNA-directed RNA polymerase subunit RPC12/RpoP
MRTQMDSPEAATSGTLPEMQKPVLEQREGPKRPVTCAHCGNSFLTFQGLYVVCSRCGGQAEPKHRYKVCIHCGQTFGHLAEFPGNRCRVCGKAQRSNLPMGMPPKSMMERFLRFVDKTEGCWFWKGGTNGKYGVVKESVPTRRSRYAHHVAYELYCGPIREGCWVLHRCDNPLCVRPNHLFLGTRRDNFDDMVKKGRARFYTPRKHRPTLTKEDVIQILLQRLEPIDALCEKFQLSRKSIKRVLSGKHRFCSLASNQHLVDHPLAHSVRTL